MGMFTQRPEDQGAWAALPGEPASPDAVDSLPPASADLLTTGVTAGSEWVVFPTPPPSPEASDYADAAPPEPEDDDS